MENEVLDKEMKNEMSPVLTDWNQKCQCKFIVFLIQTDRYRNIDVCGGG